MNKRAHSSILIHALALLTLTSTLAISGCYTASATLPGTLRGDITKENVERVGALDVEVSHTYFLHGLVGAPPATMFEGPIKRQVQSKGADGVTNMIYESKQSCGDVAWTTCTLGCVTPRTYRLTGDIVRIRAERLPGRPAKLVESDEREKNVDERVAQAY